MALLTINIPDGFVQKALIYIPLYLNYRDEVEDLETGQLIPNPESKVEFVRRNLIKYLQELYKAGKIKAAQEDLQIIREEADEESNVIT